MHGKNQKIKLEQPELPEAIAQVSVHFQSNGFPRPYVGGK